MMHNKKKIKPTSSQASFPRSYIDIFITTLTSSTACAATTAAALATTTTDIFIKLKIIHTNMLYQHIKMSANTLLVLD